MSDRITLQARYEDFDTFKRGLEKLKDSRYRDYSAYGPTNLKEIEDLMPSQFTPVRGLATVGGIFGLALFWVMCITTSLIYDLVVGGKPPISNVPYIIPAYEGTILLGSLGAFFAILLLAALGPRRAPTGYNPRFSGDSYGIEVHCRPHERAKVEELLRQTGAVEVGSPW
ncbi:MAG: DUF3341 domain-containing protein [Armatimonadota bacterium]|nr:DUF3341 domain-containing protein [bacterium]